MQGNIHCFESIQTIVRVPAVVLQKNACGNDDASRNTMKHDDNDDDGGNYVHDAIDDGRQYDNEGDDRHA